MQEPIKKTKDIVNYLEEGNLFVNSHSAFLFKKLEKIVMALYMITEFFPEKEPLKWNIRSSANDVIKDILVLTKKPSSQTAQRLRSVHRNLIEISSYTSLGHAIGLISNMNYTLLSQEISKIADNINGEVKRHPDIKETIRPELFDVEEKKDEEYSKGQGKTIKDISKNQNKIVNMSFSGKVSDLNKVLYNNDLLTNKDLNNKENILNSKLSTGSVRGGNQDRHTKILDIIKEKGKVSIKDVVRQIPGCSSKTIQRDLQKLIQDGLVSKEGERRWSIYFLTP